MTRFAQVLILTLGLAGLSPALARQPSVDSPVLLAATSGLSGPYAHTVLLALPTGSGTHIGVILNRPTTIGVAVEEPGIAAAEQPVGPVFVGGPYAGNTLLALTRSTGAPSKDSVEVLPGLYMALGTDRAVQAAAQFPGQTRLFAGLVGWEVGELEAEVSAGVWHVLEPNPQIVVGGSADDLWRRIIERRHLIVAMR